MLTTNNTPLKLAIMIFIMGYLGISCTGKTSLRDDQKYRDTLSPSKDLEGSKPSSKRDTRSTNQSADESFDESADARAIESAIENGEQIEDGVIDMDAINPSEDGVCEQKSDLTGFGGRVLRPRRTLDEESMGANQFKLKPFIGISAAYRRLGLSESCLSTARASFGEQAPRWFAREQASAVTISAVHESNFCAAHEWLTQNMAGIGNVAEDKAKDLCGKWIADACFIDPTNTQVDICADVIMVKTESESSDMKRYAHGIAAVLSSACSITY